MRSTSFVDAYNSRRLRTAGILVPIVDHPTGPTVLLTLRSPSLREHPGQIAFPGGGVDSTDTDVIETALRETWEETGIEASFIKPVGGLEPVETATGFLLFPTIAILQVGFTAIANPGEVESVFEVPLAFAMDTGNHLHNSTVIAGMKREFFSIKYKAYDIWGATAHVLVKLSEGLKSAD